MKDYIEYPISVDIYSKDSYVRQHRCCYFNAKYVRVTENQIIDHVVWEHCGKGSGAFWTSANCDPWDEDRTRFCLQDIIDICKYNGVLFEHHENTITLSNMCEELCLKVQAIITERGNKMYIKWIYTPYMYYDSVTPIIYRNELCSEEHQITVLDMRQLKQMFDFNKS